METVLSGLSTINEGGGGEALTGALNRYPGEGVGFYAILQGSLMAGANSQINFTNGPFEIRPKPFETPVIPDIPSDPGIRASGVFFSGPRNPDRDQNHAQ